MKRRFSLLVVLAFCAMPPGLMGADDLDRAPALPHAKTGEVINFALIDHRGRFHELRRVDARAAVLFFTGNGCPVARQSISKLKALRERYLERGIVVWMINSNPQDDRDTIVQEADAFRADALPVLKDDTQGVARLLGVKRSGEIIAVGTKDWRIFYRGALDDQFAEGVAKPLPTERFLDSALEEFLADKPISKSQTVAQGSLIHFEADAESAPAQASFVKEVAPILVRKCVVCHRENNIGSWVMSNYKKVKGMSDTIQEAVLTRRMPPWGADPHFGKFANDRSLTVAEAQTLLRWIERGSPRGEGEDPLPEAAKPAADWPLGRPDYIVRFPRAEEIPASGVLDLRHRILDLPFTNEVWVGAVDVKPGNRKVLHHLMVRTVNPGQTLADMGGFTGWAPGYTSRGFSDGTGKRLKKGARLHVEVHYTSIGTPQTDQTEIGLYLLPSPPGFALETRVVWDTELSIPPGEPDLKTYAITNLLEDAWLYTLSPHMHYRGSWFKYEVFYPNGLRETVLSVPRYDFNWQNIYVLSEPKRLPAGALLLCSGGFDNSARNPANPDPAKRVRWGNQSGDEMFVGAFTIAPASKPAP